MIIRGGEMRDAVEAAQLHATQIKDGFLPTLGVAFMATLYRRIVRSRHSFLMVAEDAGGIVGMGAVAHDIRGFYRSFLAHDGVKAALQALPRLTTASPRIIETLRYSRVGVDLPPAEVLAIAVRDSHQGTGLGTALVREAQRRMQAAGVAEAKVVTSLDNAAALRMYTRAGFRPITTIEVHRGTPSQVLAWP